MKNLVLVGLFVLCLNVVAKASDSVQGEVVFQNDKGDVSFNHTLHQARADDCVKCHHADSEQITPCRACHVDKEEGSIPSLKTAFHKSCKACHKEAGGPTKCNGCH